MAWVFEFAAPTGLRQMKGFDSVCTRSEDHNHLWWYNDHGVWSEMKDQLKSRMGYSSHHNHWEGAPKSFKAFKRYLRKHPELKGCEVTLVHRGCYDFGDRGIVRLDITAKWEE